MKTLLALMTWITLCSAQAESALDAGAHNRTTTAERIAADYSKNPVMADKIYRGTEFSFSGTVKHITSDEELFVELSVPQSASVFCVRCLFASTAGLENLRAGQRVAIAGTVDGLRHYKVMVRDCYLPH